MDNKLRETAKIFFKNKDARKLIGLAKLFTDDVVYLAVLEGMECGCQEFDKLCPTGDCD